MMKRYFLLACSTFLTLPLALSARQKPVATPDDYGQWESVAQPSLSPDGGWLAYVIRRVN